EELSSLVAGLDVAGLSGPEAAAITLTGARIERLAMAAKTLAAGRVAETGHCRAAGFPTAERWLADATKATSWEAGKVIETARYVADDELAVTRQALVSGELTATQANEIATASARVPGEQERLLALAARETTTQLRAECRKIRLAGKKPEDPEARRKRIAGEMAFGHRDAGGGMSELFARMPTSVLALVLAAVREQADAVFARARAEGRSDPHQAYMVEALVTLLLFGDMSGGEAGGEGGDAGGPFDDADGTAAEGPGEEEDGDGDGDGGAAPLEPDGAGAGDPRARSEGDGDEAGEARRGHAGGEHAGHEYAGHDLLYDQLLAAIRGEPPPTPPPRRERRAKMRGRCRCGGRVVPAAKIMVRVDQSALLRGYAVGDELCDIAGVGPVPVATVRELWPDAVVKAVITNGLDVANVTHLGRRATEAMATAMQFMSPCCTNVACDNERFVEIDHRLGYANVGRTRLDELDGLCRACHRLKTNDNWQLVAGTGRRRFVPPEHPDHPGHPPTPRWRGRGG
ncbi:MAG: HNH endonuclease, partial [Actinobacteria bacterium]|nr:HNH endonuclease [Actinomycetota bacterium]